MRRSVFIGDPARALAIAGVLQSEFNAICEAIHQRLGYRPVLLLD